MGTQGEGPEIHLHGPCSMEEPGKVFRAKSDIDDYGLGMAVGSVCWPGTWGRRAVCGLLHTQDRALAAWGHFML